MKKRKDSVSALIAVLGLEKEIVNHPILMKMTKEFSDKIESQILQLKTREFVRKVKPTIKTLKEALEKGHYTCYDDYIKDQSNARVFQNWYKESFPEKEIYLKTIPIDDAYDVISNFRIEEYWNDRGYETPKNAEAYLLQLMVDVPEDEMLEEFKNDPIIAYTEEGNFVSRIGLISRLCIDHHSCKYRNLDLVCLLPQGVIVFLLCKIKNVSLKD